MPPKLSPALDRAALLEFLRPRSELLASAGYPKSPAERDPPFVVIGTADVGAMAWCPEKARLKQIEMEARFAGTAIDILSRADEPPAGCDPHEWVVAVVASAPDPGRQRRRLASLNLPFFQRAQLEETLADGHAAFVASLRAADLGVEGAAAIVLVGVVDGVRSDGTVVEVTASRRTLEWAHRNGTVGHKRAQANIYAVMLGLRGWSVVLRCIDGREVMVGEADPVEAHLWLWRMLAFRTGEIDAPGVPSAESWKCRSCECAAACTQRP